LPCAAARGFAIAYLAAQKTDMPSVPALAGVPDAARQAAESVDPEKIRAHARFLAGDLLEGRGPGSRGGQLAAEYVATHFALAGARPAGTNGSYFQTVPLLAVHTDIDKTNFAFVPATGAPIPLKYGEDYVTKDQTGELSAQISAPIVFAGYGIYAPEYHWNNFDGLDVKGKVLLVIVSEPPSSDDRFFQGSYLLLPSEFVSLRRLVLGKDGGAGEHVPYLLSSGRKSRVHFKKHFWREAKLPVR
jgi:hypothetical protein